MKKINQSLTLLTIILLGINVSLRAQATTFVYTGAITTFTVPTGVTSINITAYGASGGTELDDGFLGGRGAIMSGNFAVTPGQVLNILVGQQGQNVTYEGGGGGGSFVWDNVSSTLYIAAGGGGGAGRNDLTLSGTAGVDATTANNGVNGYLMPNGGGIAGSGATIPTGGVSDYGGGGGGWLSGGNGGTGLCSDATGGSTPLTGGAGGVYGGTAGEDGNGGFGGGGGGQGRCGAVGGGGGGGYSGGGAGGELTSMIDDYTPGGGGGSYNIGTSPVNSVGNVGNGVVVINVLCSTPVAGTITGPSNVCVGANATLSDPTGSVGGVWTSTNTSVARVGSSSGIVTGVSAGTATISYSLVFSCGSAFASAVVTVNPLPAAIVYDSIICAGYPVTFTDPTSGGSWASGNPAVASADTTLGNITGLEAGVTVISYTLSTGCFVTTPPVTVNITPTAITGPTSLCMGYPETYTETARGGFWTSSSTANATIDSFTGLATPVTPGPTILVYSNGCGSDAYLPITVNPLPSIITGVLDACVSLTTTLYDSTAGGAWSSNTPALATVNAATGVVTGVAGGIATIVYTLPTTCFVTTTVIITPPLSAITGPNKVCTGSSVTLTEAVSGGAWSGSNSSIATVGTSTGVVTGVSLGIVQITYTVGSGCAAIQTMTVNPIAPIVGRDSVCIAGTGFLTDIVGGGTWMSQYPAVATVSIDSGLVYGVSAGITAITWTLPTGCMASVNLCVIPLPDAITGLAQVCPGSTITLSDITPGGTWSSANNGVATVAPNTGVVTGVFADTVTIYYSVAPGCVVGTQVLVNPDPAPIVGTDTACPGITDTLQDPTPGGVWSSTTPSLATVGSTGVVTTLAGPGGTASIQYTLTATGCASSIPIAVFPAPTPTITYDSWDGTLYADTNAGYISYQWYDSLRGEIPGATSPTLAALNTEYYYVVVTDSIGCKGISTIFEFNASWLGVKNTVGSQINIYPNPTDGLLYIASPVGVRAVVTGIDGKKELEETNAKILDLGKLAAGVYLIGLYDNSGQILSIQKLVKQ